MSTKLIIDLSPLEHSAIDIRRESLALHMVSSMCSDDKSDARVMGMCQAAHDMLPPGHDYTTLHHVWATFGEY